MMRKIAVLLLTLGIIGLTARLADAARDRVRQHFSVAHMVDRHLELFEDLVGAGSSRDKT